MALQRTPSSWSGCRLTWTKRAIALNEKKRLEVSPRGAFFVDWPGVIGSKGGVLGGCSTTPRAPDAWASVRCDITSSGKPENCVVVDEQPANEGWGDQALAIVQKGRLSRATVANAQPGAQFMVTVPFALDRDQAQPFAH